MAQQKETSTADATQERKKEKETDKPAVNGVKKDEEEELVPSLL